MSAESECVAVTSALEEARAELRALEREVSSMRVEEAEARAGAEERSAATARALAALEESRDAELKYYSTNIK